MITQLSPFPALPKPFGPHKVGTTEWEIPVSETPSPSPSPDKNVTTIKFRLFYPTTSEVKSKSAVSWLPSPQREWNQAYASFLGASPRVSSFISLLPSLLNMTNLPCVVDGPLLPREASSKYPLVIFSHGLGGNLNAYSAVCTALASFGIVCAAPEHRDGSAPMSIVRSADGRKSTTIPYQKHPHAPTAKVLNARNAQLRIRLWELEQLFTVLTSLNEGKTFSNYAVAGTKCKSGPPLENQLDLRPGHVTWAGHSFGACTAIQFVKSIYYHQHLPSWKNTEFEDDLDWRPIYTVVENSELVQQITPDSPMILLDLWAMPLRAGLTRWLWERPLPCYERKLEHGIPAPSTSVIAIVSSEFYKWPEIINRMKAALSARPADAMYMLEKRTSKDSTNHKPRTKSQLITTPVDKLPADVGEPEEIVSHRGFDENRDEDEESDAGDELFLTPFGTPGDDFPFEGIMMNRHNGFEAWRNDTDAEGTGQASVRPEREMDTESTREAVKRIKEMGLQLEPESPPVVKQDAGEGYMREVISQPLPDSDTEGDEEEGSPVDNMPANPEAGAEQAPIQDETPFLVKVTADKREAEADWNAELASDPRSSTSSNLTVSSTSASDPATSTAHLSRTPSPSPSTSTCESASSNTTSHSMSTTASSSSPPMEDHSETTASTSRARAGTKSTTVSLTTTAGPSSPFTPTSPPFSLSPLDLPKTSTSPMSNTPSPLDPHLYLIPSTAHLSQSDFGVLFPKLIRYLMNAENPVETIQLNVRAMLAVMRGRGLEVEAYQAQAEEVRRREKGGEEIEDDVDEILTDGCTEERWLRVEIY